MRKLKINLAKDESNAKTSSKKSFKNTKTKSKKTNKKKAKLLKIRAKTNKKPLLVENKVMKSYNFVSETTATHTNFYKCNHVTGLHFDVEDKPCGVSAILKLIIKINRTEPMNFNWSNVLWDITQQADMLEEGVFVTFIKHFERLDNKLAEKKIKQRQKTSFLGSFNKKNQDNDQTTSYHDAMMMACLGKGSGIIAFGAEAIVSCRDDAQLERAIDKIQNYLKANKDCRGLSYELDINKQLYPFFLTGVGNAKNADVYMEMTSDEAGVSAMFVDAGGERTNRSEYIGQSVGKMIRSRAAYPMQNKKALLIGNDTVNKTHTISGTVSAPTQIYLSQAMSRSYVLEKKKVVHFVIDKQNHVQELMNFPVKEERKMMLDTSKGHLNMLEVIGEYHQNSDVRITGRFATHLNNIIFLLNQYRDVKTVSLTDDFARATREILMEYFVMNKYYTHNPEQNLDDIRLIGRHDQYKTLANLGSWISQRRRTNKEEDKQNALNELDGIINQTILTTVPALNTKTSDLIDEILKKEYQVYDMTGFCQGAMMSGKDSTTNVMMISYLNVVLPSLENGDVVMFHGFRNLEGIQKTILEMVENSEKRIDLVFTESNPDKGLKTFEAMNGIPDLCMVDLYQNDIENLVDQFDIQADYAKALSQHPATYYVRYKENPDYLYLDMIL